MGIQHERLRIFFEMGANDTSEIAFILADRIKEMLALDDAKVVLSLGRLDKGYSIYSPAATNILQIEGTPTWGREQAMNTLRSIFGPQIRSSNELNRIIKIVFNIDQPDFAITLG